MAKDDLLGPPLRSVVDAASWKLAADLARRDPEIVVRRTHPGGGQYDCLTIASPESHTIELNREGRIHLFGETGHSGDAEWGPVEWSFYLRSDPRRFAADLARSACLADHERLPPSTPRVLVYRLLAATSKLNMLSEPAEITMSTIDSSDVGGGGPASWLEDFPDVARLIDGGRDPFGFWLARARELEMVLDVDNGVAIRRDGAELDLMEYYKLDARNFASMLGRVLTWAARHESAAPAHGPAGDTQP